MRNPYSSTSPAVGEDFFDRAVLLEEITSSFISFSPSAPYLVIGDRRSGKTSLLKAVANGLVQRKGKGGRNVLPVYVDLALYTPRSETEFYSGCISTLDRALAADNLDLMGFYKANLQLLDTPTLSFIETIMYAASENRCAPRVERIVFLVDEFDVLRRWRSEDFLDFSEHMKAALTYESIPLAMVFAGTMKSYVVSEVRGSPLFSIIKTVFLEPFSKEDSTALISKPRVLGEMASSFNDQIVQRIWELTGGHPFLIQSMMHFICAMLIDRASKLASETYNANGETVLSWEQSCARELRKQIVTDEDIQSAELSMAEDFKKWYDKLEEPVRRVYRQIVGGDPDRGIPLRALRSKDREIMEDSYFDDRLMTLRSMGIITSRYDEDFGVCYMPAGQAFKKWFLAQPSEVRS